MTESAIRARPLRAEPSPRVVMLHGFTGSGSSFDRLVGHLPADWTFRRPDLVGHGTAASIEVADYAAEVARLISLLDRSVLDRGTDLDQLGGRRHLVGYSMGARLGLGMLLRSPERFASATLIGVHPGLGAGEQKQTRIEDDERWARTIEEKGLDSFLDTWSQLPLFASQRRLPAEVLEPQQLIRSGHSASGMARAMRTLSLGRMPDHREDLERLALGAGPIPMRLVVGSLDHKFLALGRSLIERLSDSPADARLEIVEGVGHNVLLEAPHAVAGFLREAVADSPPAVKEATG